MRKMRHCDNHRIHAQVSVQIFFAAVRFLSSKSEMAVTTPFFIFPSWKNFKCPYPIFPTPFFKSLPIRDIFTFFFHPKIKILTIYI